MGCEFGYTQEPAEATIISPATSTSAPGSAGDAVIELSIWNAAPFVIDNIRRSSQQDHQHQPHEVLTLPC